MPTREKTGNQVLRYWLTLFAPHGYISNKTMEKPPTAVTCTARRHFVNVASLPLLGGIVRRKMWRGHARGTEGVEVRSAKTPNLRRGDKGWGGEKPPPLPVDVFARTCNVIVVGSELSKASFNGSQITALIKLNI